jgi:dihydropteroate synthase
MGKGKKGKGEEGETRRNSADVSPPLPFSLPLWRCGRYSLPIGRKTLVMGIVNATPDSFSGDGVLDSMAIERALQMAADGADILDIGGESTRPGAEIISLEDEWNRVAPILKTLVARIEIPLSLDTTKAEVARRALENGASIINDISGATADAAMPGVLQAGDCGIVLMHRRGTSQTMQYSAKVKTEKVPNMGEQSEDLIEEIQNFWRARVTALDDLRIPNERICLDAGFGFGKSLEENLEILRRGRELKSFQVQDFQFPILSATSRKSTIGKVLGNLPPEERIFGTAATTAIAICNGADIIRVHDVKEMAEVARMTDAVTRN